MSSLILPRRFYSQPQGAVGIAPGWNPRKIIYGEQGVTSYTIGANVSRATGGAGQALGVTANIFSGSAGAPYAINLGTRPSSATFVAVIERNVDCESTNSIPYIVNFRTGNEANYSSIALGNSYNTAGNKNKIHSGGIGDTVDGLWVNGVKQASAGNSDAQMATNTPLVIVCSYSVLRGSEYTLFAHASFAGPVKLYLFAEMPLLNDAAAAELARNPWQLFKPRKNILYFDAGSAGGPAADLAGTATDQSTAVGALSTAIPIGGAAAVVATASGALSTAIPLAGQSASISVAGGVLTAQIKLTGAALAQAVAAGGLSGGAAQLAGAAADSASAAGSLTTQISLSGVALTQALAAAGLTTTPSGLAGSAAAQASATGALLTNIKLAGTASAWAASTGGLSTLITMSGVAASVSSATGALTLSGTLSGSALAQAIAAGSLTTIIRLDAAALARAAASGSLGGAPTASIRTWPIRASARNWTARVKKRNWSIAA